MIVNNNNPISPFYCSHANEATSKSDPACSGDGGAEFGELMEDLLMFQVLLINTCLKPPAGPMPPLPSLPAWSGIHIQVPSFHTCKVVDVQRARVLPRSCSVHKLSRSPSYWHHVQGTFCHSDNKLYFQGPSLSSCHPLCPQDPSRIQAHSLKHWAGSAVFPIPSSLFLSFLPIYENPLSHFPLTKNNFFNHILSGIFHQFPRLG